MSLGALALMTAFSFQIANAESKPLKVAGSVWPPFIVDKGAEKGAATALVTEILKRAGYKTEVSIETWPRTLEGTSAGIYDVIIAAWKTKESDLNRRRAKGAYLQPVALRVSLQINQNVDLIFVHTCCCPFMTEIGYVNESVAILLNSRPIAALVIRSIGVATDLKLIPVVQAEQADHEVCCGMIVKVA